MSYRINHHEHRHQPSTVKDITSPGDFIVTNGASGVMGYPCFYYIMRPPAKGYKHNKNLHNHLGWPSPSFPDQSCQEHIFDTHIHLDKEHEMSVFYGQHHAAVRNYIDMNQCVPIKLRDEGYSATSVDISADHIIQDGTFAITCSGIIDPEEQHVVKVFFDVKDPLAKEEKQIYRFSVRVHNYGTGAVDVVAHGRLIVLPAWIDDVLYVEPEPEPEPEPIVPPDIPKDFPFWLRCPICGELVESGVSGTSITCPDCKYNLIKAAGLGTQATRSYCKWCGEEVPRVPIDNEPPYICEKCGMPAGIRKDDDEQES